MPKPSSASHPPPRPTPSLRGTLPLLRLRRLKKIIMCHFSWTAPRSHSLCPVALSSRSQCKGLSGKQLLVVRTHTCTHDGLRLNRASDRESERLKRMETAGESGCYVGVLSSNGFSSFALFSPFHLLGSLMGADLTTGAGTSAGKDEPPPPPPHPAHAVVG